MLLFFLSHEYGQNGDLIRRFFDDLCDEVSHHIGLRPTETIGFMDHEEVPVDGDWPAARLAALQECRTFVVLCSPRYFGSVECSREWSFFHDRLVRREPDIHSPALIPLIWTPTDLPDQVSHLQYADPLFSERYQALGLRQLMRLDRHRDDYLEFVTAVATRLKTAAKVDGPPALPVPQRFAETPPAFEIRQPAVPVPPQRPSPRRTDFPFLCLDQPRRADQ